MSTTTTIINSGYYTIQKDNVECRRDQLLNSKMYYLNKSSSKFVNVGIGLGDFLPKVVIGGQRGFRITLNEEDWKNLLRYQGVIVNYFYSYLQDMSPIKLDNITIYFENYNNKPIIKVQENGGSYVCLSSDSTDKLWELQEIIDYRIQIYKRQEFKKYFNVFLPLNNQSSNLFTNIYNTLNPSQNPNSENVCTMLELMKVYPDELEFKLSRNGTKRKFFEEVCDFQRDSK